MMLLCLFAQQGKAKGSPFDRPEILFGSAGLAAALLVGAFVIFLVDRWRKRAALAEAADAGSELTTFRALYERGEITEEEYTRLRQKVSERVKNPVEGAIPPAGPPIPPLQNGPAQSGPGHQPYIPGSLPPEYFDDPEIPGRGQGGDQPPGERPPPA